MLIMIQKFIKRHRLILEELEQTKKELEWYQRYSHYISNVHNTVDGEASGYADGDEEYEENFK